MTVLVVGCDPGTTSGWAAVVDGLLVASGTLDAERMALFRVLRDARDKYPADERHMVCEDQFLPRQHATKEGKAEATADEAVADVSNRFRAVAKVICIRGWWEEAAALLGYTVAEPVLASQWQGKTGVIKLANLRFKGQPVPRKKASRLMVEQQTGKKVGADEADSICLAVYWAAELRQAKVTAATAAKVTASKQLPLPGGTAK
jgi:hypothetical protein